VSAVPAIDVVACPHCGTAVEGPEGTFCCAGCELAYQIVSDAGLEAYYARRDALPDRPTGLTADWASVPVELGPDGRAHARLVVDGLRCAACVWVIENLLQRTDGVDAAQVSYASGRAALTWDPERTTLAELASRVAALGYRPRPVDATPTSDRDLLTRLGVAAFCAMNIMLVAAAVYAGWFDGMEARYAALFRWTTLALATPVALWSAAPFFRGAAQGLRHGVLHMDLPIALAVAVLYGHGLVATRLGQDAYLDSLAMLVALLLGGRVLEARGRRAAAAAASALASTLPSVARRRVPGGVEAVGVDALAVGDVVEVGPGEEVPADGVVVDGAAEVRLAMLTGEAEPVRVVPSDAVVAGAPVLDGAIGVRVERTGAETLGRRMADEVLRSVDRGLERSPADRLAPAFTAATLLAAGATFLGWSLASDVGTALHHTVAVLVVACPCALALSWPLAAAAGLGALGRRGLVLRRGDVLLKLARVDAVALDKTGTVTTGEPVVVEADDEVLRIAAGLERASSHPIARAVLAAARARGVALPRATGLQEVPGVGPSGIVDGRRWSLRAGGPGEVLLLGESGPAGVIRLRDVCRDDARAVVERLEARAPVTLLTGDHPEVARRIAAEAGVSRVEARQGPHDKLAWIRERQAAGSTVLFVGDGLNDGPALAAADVGLAMGSGATSSVLAADGVVGRDGLGPALAALRVARVVARTVRLNMIRSVLYNATAVLAAAAGLVDPLVAAVLMPVSSLVVIGSALGIEGRVREEERWTSSSC